MKEKDKITLEKAIEAMREKLEQQIPLFKEMPLAQVVTVGTGESMLRANPAVAEFRALVRDYAATLKSINDLEGKEGSGADDALFDLRSRFRVVK